MCNRVNPNFEEWAKHILDRSELADALKQAFDQGWHAGYHDGEQHSWVDALEDDEVFQRLGDGLETVKVRVEDLVEGVDFDLNKKEEEQGC